MALPPNKELFPLRITLPVPDRVPELQSKPLLITMSPVPVNSPPAKLKLLESLIIADSKVTEAPVIAICPLPLRVPPVIP